MEVLIAGYNIDSELLAEIARNNESVTPETLSAAYARISRDPRPIPELRAQSLHDVEKARKSNQTIVFGLGHSSVAEHAVFNLDILGVSRLAVEAIQAHRLNSYTEKSQRYIEIGKDFVTPQEIKGKPIEKEYNEFVHECFQAYNQALGKLKPYFFDKYPEAKNKKSEMRMIEGLAKEDARYLLPLSTTSQLGMTINARNLEYMLRRLNGEKLLELQELSGKIYNIVYQLAPSLIKYIEPREYSPAPLDSEIRKTVNQIAAGSEEVLLLDETQNAEEKIIAAILFPQTGSWKIAIDTASKMSQEEKKNFIIKRLANMEPWDQVPREFELAEFTFELTISSSCFAQMKRHRMATILTSGYNPELGITIPESILETDQEGLLDEIRKKAELIFDKIIDYTPAATPYALLNSHRRKILIKMNAREIYHFSRLREDEHAQWDIRNLANKMLDILRKQAPALFILTCGKHDFHKVKTAIYS
ncbi:MAG: FAD-dependent thymidylate synthase [Acidobacteria bacterium]|nr:FAD-dependent thymidylate synthase [Acidobacteriota bacterium]